MTRSRWFLCNRITAKIQFTIMLVLVLVLGGAANHLGALQQSSTQGPKIWLGERQQLPMQAGGAPAAKGAFASAAATSVPTAGQPISLLTADVDEDGVPDLLVGYNGYLGIQRGNVDAFAPQSDASFQAITHGQFPAPFLPQQAVLSTPVNPDFIAVGHFTPSGHNDLVIAAKGSSALYVFAGDGTGNFASPEEVKLPGGVTVMAGGDLGQVQPFKQIVVGMNAASGPELAIFTGSADGLDPLAAFPLSGQASNLNFADFGDGGTDLAFLTGGKVQILRSATMKLQQVSLPITASALTVGKFVNDRIPGQQLALLTADGALHIAAHNEFDPRAYTIDELKAMRKGARILGEVNPLQPVKAFPANGWKIVEDINAAATFPAGQAPVMFRTRISDHQMDDVMVLNGASGLLTIVQHPDVAPGAETFAPAVLSTRPYSGTPIAAIPQRINIDGRAGVLAIHAGESAPSMLMPLPDPTFVVNTTVDLVSANPNACLNAVAGQCSLREAILEANANNNGGTTTDTISVPAGTYTLTLPRVAGDETGKHGTLEVTDSVNIVGAGQATTIIQGGALANLSDSVDKVFSFNEDIQVLSSATVSLSNLTIQHGRNRGDCCATQDGFGGAFDFDTGSAGTASLSMDHVTIQNNAIFDGRGGGIAVFNVTHPGPGTVTITNSIIQNNDGTSNGSCCGEGGGIMTDVHTVMSMSNTQVLNNHTHASGSILPEGGGIFLQGQHTTPQNHISGGSISGNTAAGKGGGISSTANLLMDGGTVVSNNTAADTGAGAFHAGGGGIANDGFDGMTLNNVTFTGNSTAGNGGAIFTGDGSGLSAVTIHFSRFAGNSASSTPGSSNLFNVTATVAGTGNPVTATNNWWGSNVPANSISQGGSPAVSTCPAAATSSVVCFDPFIVLTNQTVRPADPAKIKINGTTTLTGSLARDNHGAAIGNANLTQIAGLPITFVSGPLGTIPQAQPEILSPAASATATFNAGGTSGRANPTATVDQGTALANDSLIAAASETGSTVTITTVGAHGFAVGDTVVVSGVGVSGYNGTFTIASIVANPGNQPVQFTYTDPTTGLGASSGGTANVGIVILEPPTITKTFGAATIPVNGTTTVNFSINNPNVVPINTSFTDLLPTGLQVSASPTVSNSCGGTVTATAGAGTISFSNNLTAVGSCAISVTITGTVDNQYTNSVQILSTDAGNGNTSSANITVINPPTIAKAFGAATIPLNG
ncbi:MAG TPA: CSLREA domain-containing protein, partial [Candidatus Angelobacter sp.]|nr:CSLREA domain-containing protein [Candidatus Angelobacter sp.]